MPVVLGSLRSTVAGVKRRNASEYRHSRQRFARWSLSAAAGLAGAAAVYHAVLLGHGGAQGSLPTLMYLGLMMAILANLLDHRNGDAGEEKRPLRVLLQAGAYIPAAVILLLVNGQDRAESVSETGAYLAWLAFGALAALYMAGPHTLPSWTKRFAGWTLTAAGYLLLLSFLYGVDVHLTSLAPVSLVLLLLGGSCLLTTSPRLGSHSTLRSVGAFPACALMIVPLVHGVSLAVDVRYRLLAEMLGVLIMSSCVSMVAWACCRRLGTNDSPERTEAPVVTGAPCPSSPSADAEEAAAATRAAHRMLAHAVHESTTPLCCAMGFAELMELDRIEPLSARHRANLKKITESLHDVLRLNRELREFSSSAQRDLKVDMSKVTLRDVLAGAVESMRPLAQERSIAIRIVEPQGPIVAWVDPNRLRQIVLNLLSNSVKYGRQGGTVTVSVERPRDSERIAVTVSDDGPGLRSARLGRFFEPIARMARDDEAIPGMGLGLSISQALARRMGGNINIQGTDGSGVAVTVIVNPPAAG